MSDDTTEVLQQRAPWVLIFAHPGHELRTHHLMERVAPSVSVITDGSGSTNTPRLEESRRLLARTGARAGAMFGRLSDRQAYTALMTGDARPFLEIVDGVVDMLVTDGIRTAVVDAAEGYNPVHDLCHWIGRVATARARRFGVKTALFEVDLVSDPGSPGDGVRLVLDDQAFARKLDSTSQYVALKAEADAAFDRYGPDAFRVEFLRPVAPMAPPPPSWVPYYEQVGEARVRSGSYSSVLRYGSHVRPIVERLLGSVQPPRHATRFRPVNE